MPNLIGSLHNSQTRRKLCRYDRKRFRVSLIVGLLGLALLLLLAVSFLGCSLAESVQPTTSGSTVVIANFNVPVDPGSSAFMSRVVTTAQNDHAAAIVIEMNTPGGSVSDMLNIISAITTANQTGIPTYTFIVPNGAGASAGSYIAMASNKILMAPGSAIGPSTPIVVGGTALEQNHTQAYFLSYMQSLAQNWGRNTTAVYYMVQSDEAFSANDAVANHVADGTANSLSDALNQLGLSGNPQVTLGENIYEQLLSALSNATLDGILFLIGVIAIVIDIFHPTIILTILGIIAIVAGLVGAEIIGASLARHSYTHHSCGINHCGAKTWTRLRPRRRSNPWRHRNLLPLIGLQYSPSPITGLVEVELALLVVFGVIMGLYIRWIIKPLRRRTKLTGADAMIGKKGVALTDLKPKGEVRVVGEIWHAESLSGDIAQGEQVTVKALKGLVVIVEKVQEQKIEQKNSP